MNYNQIYILFLQGALVAFVLLLLFRLRKSLGIGVLFACLGLFQFMQVFLSSTLYVEVYNNILISSGSSVLFTVTLFTLLIIYIKEDASETKKIIYALFIVNMVMSLLLQTFSWNLKGTDTHNFYNVSTNLFDTSAWVLFVGTIVLFLDSLLIIVLYEFIARKFTSLFFRIFITMLVVLSFDTLCFSLIAFWNLKNLNSIVISGLISKGVFAVFYSFIFYLYLKYFDSKERLSYLLNIKDVFKPLTYKQKLETVTHDFERQKQYREKELLSLNKEKEKRIKELELSRLEVQNTLELLEKKKQTMNEISKMARIGFFEDDIATDIRIWSEYLFHIFGLDSNQPIPPEKNIIALFKQGSKEKLEKAMLNLDNKGTPFNIQLNLVNFKQKDIWIRSIAEPVYNDLNEIVGRRGAIYNITNKKRNEIKLKESEEKFFKTFKNSPNLIILTRIRDYKIIDANDAAVRVTGYSPEELKNNIKAPINIWKHVDKRKEFFDALIENNRIKDYEAEFITKTGETRVWKASSEVITISKEKYALNIIEDITEIRATHQELITKTEFITAMTDNQPAGIIACNSEGKLVLFNKTAKKWHGIDIMKIPQEEWAANYGLYKEDGVTLLKKEEIPLLKAFNGEKITDEEIVIKVKNHKPRTVICNGISFSDSNGKKLGATIVMSDITEQKIAENNLKKSQVEIKKALKEVERSEFLLNESGRLAKVGAWELKLPSQKIRWSDQVFKIHGIPIGEVPPLEECIGFYVDGADKILEKAIEESILEKKKFDLVVRFRNKQNKKLWINSIGYPLLNKNGEVVSLIGVIQDITEQKTRQIKLDAQNEKLNSLNKALNEAQELSHLGSWEYIEETGKVTWSQELFNIYEREVELGAPNYSEHKKLYTEESFILMNKAVENCLQNKTPYNLELDIITFKGKLKHIVSRGRVIKDNNNKVIGCYGTAQDITEQKQIRDKIKKAEEMYRLLTDNSNDLICLHKLDSTFKYISPSIKSILGYEQSELIGTLGFNIIHQEDVSYFTESIKNRALKKVPNDTFIFRILHKRGNILWLECSISVIYLGEEIDYILTSSRDVTDKIKAKKEIQDYQASLQELTTEITLIEEKQKKEIASNIHDHLSQSLVISNMKLKELRKNPELKKIKTELDFIYEHVAEALENSRKITSELSPPILYQLGIIEALYWLLENIENKHNIECKINHDIDELQLDDVKSILLYRSIQELINNILKYAKATLIVINLSTNKDGLEIEIKDNGVGFDITKLNNFYTRRENGSGFGLFTVKERIRNIDGNFKISSEINKGTTVIIFIPID